MENCEDIVDQNFNFKLLTFNIRSIQKNFNSFLVALQRLKSKIDVIVLTECWLSSGVRPGQIPGYNTYATKNNLNRAGGVVAYISEKWDATVDEPAFEEAECLKIKLSESMIIFGIYRSPSFPQMTRFITCLGNSLNPIGNMSTVVVAGDININIVDMVDQTTNEYLCAMAEFGFRPAITSPTRLDSCLDHIFIRTKARTVTGIVCKTSITDHDFALLAMSLTADGRGQRLRCASKTDIRGIVLELEGVDWSAVTSVTDADAAAEIFSNILMPIIQRHTSKKEVGRAKYIIKPWITPGLLRCQKHRDRLHLELRKHPNDPVRKLVYKRYRNFLSQLQHKLKCDFESKALEDNKCNTKGLWKVIGKIAGYKNSTTPSTDLLKLNRSPLESVNDCNEYFIGVGKKLSHALLTNLDKTEATLSSHLTSAMSSPHTLFFQPTDEYEVDKLISQLRNDSAPGIDGLKAPLLKAIKSAVVPPLTHIYNLSLSTGVFPRLWKKATVIPIHKSGQRGNPENYRPISLLVNFSKILEKIVNRRLVGYLERFGLLSDRQYGFRLQKSSEDALNYLTTQVTTCLDDGRRCVGVFLDLARAFDTVSVTMLIKKLEFYGIRGLPLQWFRSYLTERCQSVRVGEYLSKELPITFGVPQGSVLGPTLFIIYMNDIFSASASRADLVCYADDTAALFYGNTWNDVLRSAEAGMNVLKQWLDNNLLTLNLKKTKYICFHKTKASEPKFPTDLKIHSKCNASACDCGSVDRTECMRYLGVEMDQHLSFKPHIVTLAQRVRKLMYVMRLLRDSADKRVLRLVYVSLCESILGYGISVWGGAGKTAMLGLERAQRSVLKVMHRKPFQYPTHQLHTEAGVLSVRQLFICRVVVIMHHRTINSQEYSALLKKRIFRIPQAATGSPFARRFPQFLHSYIYNKVVKLCNIQKYNMKQMLVIVRKWLLLLNHMETEELLKIAM